MPKKAAAPTLDDSMFSRPHPPAEMVDEVVNALAETTGKAFLPAPDVEEWIRGAFLDESGPLFDLDHVHLKQAHIGVLWTCVPNIRRGRLVAGQAEMPSQSNMGSKWQRGRVEQQLVQWFGATPDFLITLDAVHAANMDDVSFCALIDHELRHCAQAIDQNGAPKFSRETGKPTFALRGHDVEEFIGTVRRFGIADNSVRALVDAAGRAPEIGRARIAQACGTCLRAAA